MNKPKTPVIAANGNTGFPVREFVRIPNNPKAMELRKLAAELFKQDIEDVRETRKTPEGVERRRTS